MLDNKRAYYLQQMGINIWQSRTKKCAQVILLIAHANNNAKARIIILSDSLQYEKSIRLLNNMLASIDFSEVTSIEQCNEDLVQQITALQPKVLFVVGNIANQYTQQQNYQNIPVIVSYNLDDLLCNSTNKRHAYKDLLLIKDYCL